MEFVDKTEKWRKVPFNSTDAVEVTATAGDGKQIRGIRKLKSREQLPSDARHTNGWDHEHCEVCWAHINPGDYAHRNERDSWVCLNCFDRKAL